MKDVALGGVNAGKCSAELEQMEMEVEMEMGATFSTTCRSPDRILWWTNRSVIVVVVMQ